MKNISLCFLSLAIFFCADCQHSPASMPPDFSISISEQGGLTQLSGRIIISLDSCISEEKHRDTLLRRYEWKLTAEKLSVLYDSLFQLGSFNIRFLAYHGRSYDGGSTFVYFRMNGKQHRIIESANNRVVKGDLPVYRETMAMIRRFVDRCLKEQALLN
jgi:hypothetical protein